MTTIHKAIVKIEKLYCDNCGHEMINSNNMLTTYPPQYSYFCPACNEILTSFIEYPRIIYDIKE